MYDENTKSFVITNKEEAIKSLIEFKICDIEDFYELYKEVLDEKVRTIIETIIEDRYENNDKQKQNKQIIEDITFLMYNNRNIVKHLI
jgi:hypothetical protein